MKLIFKNPFKFFLSLKTPYFNNLKILSPLSKFYFKKLYYTNNILSVFKLNKLDWLSQTMARLTKFSFLLNPNDYFLSKSVLKYATFLSLSTSFILLNLSHESNYALTHHFKKNSDRGQFFDKFKFVKPLKKTNKIFYEFMDSKISNLKKISTFCNFDFIMAFYFKPLFFKYFYYFFIKKNPKSVKTFSLLENITYFKDFFFYSENNAIFSNNILPNIKFNYILKKKMLKIFNYSKFPTVTTLWHYNTLIRFLEFCSGKKVFVKFFNFLITNLTFSEKAQCLLWAQKVKYFRKVLGPRLFLNESLQIIYLSLKLKDPYILSNWMISTMYKISFWKYKTFLRYIKYVLRYFFWVIFKDLKIKGIKFQLKGKISVAGNARTRTVFHNVGFTSHTTFNNKILYNLNLVRSFTGVMGLKLWIVF